MVAKVRTKRLGDIHTGFLGTVDKHIRTMGTVDIQGIENGFHKDTRTRHDRKADDIGHEKDTEGSRSLVKKALGQKAEEYK